MGLGSELGALGASRVKSFLQKSTRASRTPEQIRVYLAEAYGFVRGVHSTGTAYNYSLEQAIADRIKALEGGGPQPALLDRLDSLDNLMNQVVLQAIQLPDEELSVDAVTSLSTEGVLGGKIGSVLGSILGGASLTDVIAGEAKGAVESAVDVESVWK